MIFRLVTPFLFVAAGALLLPVTLPAQTSGAPPRTDFSGRWRMVKDQSDFGAFHVPDIIVRVIDQREQTMNVHTVQTTGSKTTSSDVSYFTDGSVTKNVINGRDAESKSFWDGPTLVIRTNMKTSQGDAEQIVDRWDLSEDRNTLTTTSRITTPRGGVDMKLVCRREKPDS
jgi:hypothetical protein